VVGRVVCIFVAGLLISWHTLRARFEPLQNLWSVWCLNVSTLASGNDAARHTGCNVDSKYWYCCRIACRIARAAEGGEGKHPIPHKSQQHAALLSSCLTRAAIDAQGKAGEGRFDILVPETCPCHGVLLPVPLYLRQLLVDHLPGCRLHPQGRTC
jgi:hypothetical protein